jgi:Flp pilus assembly protein TadG
MSTKSVRNRLKGHRSGQTTVEFALAFIIVAMGIFGVIDVAHAVFEEHGLTRAAEAIARDLSVTSGPLDASAITAAISDAHTKSQIDFNTLATTTLTTGVMSGSDCVTGTGGTPCQKLTNCPVAIVNSQCTDPSANGKGWVDVIGTPSLCNGSTKTAVPQLGDCLALSKNDQNITDQVQVKITINNYGPHTTFFNSFPISTVSSSASSETNGYLQGN